MASASATQTRNTRQRQAVVAALSRRRSFRSAQQIHQQLLGANVQIGLSTVYRALAALAAAGEVDVQVNPEGESLFRMCGSDNHHHHLTCRECGRAVEISGDEVEQWAKRVGRNHGFTAVEHTVELTGICRDCR